jgi:hypothetical protein
MANLEWEVLERAVSKMTAEEKQRLLALLEFSLDSEAKAEVKLRIPADAFETELAKVVFDASALPSDFSRADIYLEHD